jgi:hypothetical protein
MASTKMKKLNTNLLVKDAKGFDTLRTVELGEVYTEIYENFSNERIDDCLDDFGKFISEYGQRKKASEKKIQDYMGLFIIKWFSTALDIQKNSFEENIVLFDQLLKSDYIEQIIDSFDKNDLAKVMERMQKKLELVVEVAKKNKEVRQQIRERIEGSELENKDEIMNVFFNRESVSKVDVNE